MGLALPARDEEAALPLVLADLPPGSVDLIVVCDNGSRDRTAERARAAGAFVVHEPRAGYGRACRAAVEVLLGTRAADLSPQGGVPLRPLADEDVLVFLDADHSDHADEIGALLRPIAAGEADFVVGSRILGGAGADALLPQARLGNRLACFLMRLLFGARYTDLGPFRAIRVRAFRHLAMRDLDFGWTVEMQLKACVARLRVREVPVSYRARLGRSKITGTLSGTLRAGCKILAWILGWRLALWLTPRRIPMYPGSSPSGSR